MGLDVFRTAPAPLSTPQRRLVLATAIFVAATRLIAISATLWDWDEALFVLAVREYEVTQHHPHPPGFPVFVAAAKLVAFFGVSEFRALQTIVVLAAMALFPLLFFLARELRFEFRTAYLAALLFAFFPNVWFYGGTALSDVAALALIVTACALLLRGCRDVRSYYAGAVVLALAAGVRPQSLMMALVPALLASWIQFRSSWKRFVLATLLGAVILAACYAGAILASESPSAYLATMRGLSKYLHDVDSISNPHRQPLAQVAEPIFLRPMRGGRLPLVVLALASIGVIASFVKRHAGVWILLAIFLPFTIFAWLMLDTNSMCRYAIVWLPMYALLCAYGAGAVGR
ncbi:MAG TPA: hypothetical protein VMU84_18145 [Thermoanaerobaculia bacterium]|nr:hypothetical protein [Thermoanaerobaculia bacterium]